MKSIKFFALFLIGITVISCTKSTLVEDTIPTGGTFIKFNQSNMSYTLNNPIITDLSNTKIDAFQGSDASLVSITLYMPLDATIGTHFMTDDPTDDNTYCAYYIQ